MRAQRTSAFTLIESLVAMAVLVVVIGGALEVINRTIDNSTFAKNQFAFLMETQYWIDELIYQSDQDFGKVLTDYNNLTFTSTTAVNNKGVIYVTNMHPGTTAATTCLLKVKAVICWDEKGRIIGEDKNLNGVLDSGEDSNGNNELDSPCQIETALARKD